MTDWRDLETLPAGKTVEGRTPNGPIVGRSRRPNRHPGGTGNTLTASDGLRYVIDAWRPVTKSDGGAQ